MKNISIGLLAFMLASCHQGTVKGPADGQVSKPLTIIPIGPEDAPRVMMGAPFNSLNHEHASGFSNESSPGCVVADEVGTIGGVTNGLETYQITTISSQSEFFRQLDINSKAKAHALVDMISFKGGHDLKSMASIRINKNYSYALVTARKLWQSRQIKKASINPQLMGILREDPKKFFGICGDEYLSSIGLITEAHGVLECKSSTKEEKFKVDATLDSSVGLKDVWGVESSFQAIVEGLNKNTNAKCQLYVWQRGGRGNISDKPETFGTSIANYVAGASYDGAAITDFGTTKYKNALIDAELWKILQGVNLEFNVPRSLIKMWQAELEVVTERMERALDLIDNETDAVKKAQMYVDAKKYTETVKIIEDNIARCSARPDVYEACRDSRNTEEPWPNPDEPIIED